jgi:8-oxo-dGTP diphosphatase
MKKTYCPQCKKPLVIKFVDGRDRLYCPACGEPLYENPVPVAACVVCDAAGKVLLVKRAIPPRKGMWCLPGGFVELDESAEQAALRELLEETGLAGGNARLIDVVAASSERYTSVLMIGYLIGTVSGILRPGDDSEDAAYFGPAAVPELAFSSHRTILDRALVMIKHSGQRR